MRKSNYDVDYGGGGHNYDRFQERERYRYADEPHYQQPMPRNDAYASTDRPIVNKDDKKFVLWELRKLKLRSYIALALFTLIFLVAGVLIAVFVTSNYSFGFEDSIKGKAHLVWMAIGAFVGFIFTIFYSMKLYLLRKDSFRTRSVGQNDFYVPLSLKKYYRSLKSNNTFIHYFATLGYLFLAAAIGIVYLVSYQGFIAKSFILIDNEKELLSYVIPFGIALAAVLAIHVVLIIFRFRKASIYDARFGFEIVPKEQIIALKKRNRRICIFITLVLLLVGVIVYFILKRLKPSIPNLLSLKG